VSGEATAEAGAAEQTEAEDTGQALWNVTEEELTAQAPAERPTASLDFAAASGGVEAPFELEELAVESSPLPDLESTPRVELWAEVEEGSPAEESLEDLLGAAELAWSEAAEQSEGLEEPEVAAAQGFTAELSLAELLASETVEAQKTRRSGRSWSRCFQPQKRSLLQQLLPPSRRILSTVSRRCLPRRPRPKSWAGGLANLHRLWIPMATARSIWRS
jgi:hypothetical protein